MKSNIFISIFFLLLLSTGYSQTDISFSTKKFLKRPTGAYHVGFEDVHWINQDACPDVNFNGKNQDDFSPNNIKRCHEIMARIYYPSSPKNRSYSPYYPPSVKSMLEGIQGLIPDTPQNELNQFKHITSFSQKKSDIVKNQKFPVLFFIPGLGWPPELYENSISELVSHGYIVIGISSPFINLVELPNGHIIDPEKLPPKSPEEIEAALVPIQKNDLSYVYNAIQRQHNLNAVFVAMDLTRLGVFGHSMGGRVLADISHEHPTWFQAGATLDIGFDTTNNARNKFTFPFMHEISANRTLVSTGLPVTFELGNNGYLVVISPDEQNHTYSYHGNFADYSTLQYAPAFKKFLTYAKEQGIKEAFDVKIMTHEPTSQELTKFTKKTYILVNNDGEWRGAIYVNKAKQTDFDISIIEGLGRELNDLSGMSLEKMSTAELEPVVKKIAVLHTMLAAPLGEGNGWEITEAVNTYLLGFFDTYLKEKTNPSFNECIPLYKNTYIKCGPDEV
ncbi:alpha/beta hydrolase [Legionella sp. CNM-4043-24]|uniref:alpha/beta hydrolase n=1 Tax=Legionella sp. CNM-4043-24 TaxID=3421646 RepID=UPI00403AB82F